MVINLILALLFAATFQMLAVAKNFSIEFRTDWCKKSSIYQKLDTIYQESQQEYSRVIQDIQQLQLLLNNKGQLLPNDNIIAQLEYVHQIERQEAQRYAVDQYTNILMWKKAINTQQNLVSRVIVYDLDGHRYQVDLSQQNKKSLIMQQELNLKKDKIYYKNLTSTEILFVYLDIQMCLRKPDICQEILNQLSTQNIVVRYKFSECDQTNQEYTPKEMLTGIGLKIMVSDYYFHVANNPEYLKRWLLRTKDFDTFVDILQNHNKVSNKGQLEVFEGENPQLQWDIQQSLSRQQFIIIGYKLIRLDQSTSDPHYLDKEIRTAYNNTLRLRELTSDPQALFQNIIRYKFSNKLTQYHPSNRLLKDIEKFMINRDPNDLEKINEFLLIVEQQGHIKEFESMRISLSQQKSYQIGLYNIGHCLTSNIQDNQIEQDNQNSINECPKLSRENDVKNAYQRKQQLCFKHGLCSFPFLYVNGFIIDYAISQNAIKNPKTYLQEILKLTQKRQIIQNQEKQDKITKLKHFIPLVDNHISIRNEITVIRPAGKNYYNDLQINSDSNVLIQYLTQDDQVSQRFQNVITSYNQLDYLQAVAVRINGLNDFELKGSIPLGKQIYVFLNGLLLNSIDDDSIDEFKIFDYIRIENAKINKVLKNMGRKVKGSICQLMTEINFMNILQENDEQLLSEYDRLKGQPFQHQFINSETDENPINIYAKLSFLSLESVAFITYIHQSRHMYNFQLDLHALYQNFDFRKMSDYPYHNYHLIINEPLKQVIKIKDIESPYPQLQFHLQQTQGVNFIVDELSHFNSYFTNNTNPHPVIGFNFTLEFNIVYFRDLLQEDEEVLVAFRLKQTQQIVKILQSPIKSEEFSTVVQDNRQKFILHDYSNIYRKKPRIMRDYYILITPTLGRFFLTREDTNDTEIINIDSLHFELSSNNVIFEDRQVTSQIQSTDQQQMLQYYPLREEFQFLVEQEQVSSQRKDDTIHLYYQVSGSEYETVLLYQIYQIIVNDPSQNFKIHVIENLFISPFFRESLIKLANELDFDYSFFTFEWPWSIIFRPRLIYQENVIFRILFSDQMFDHKIKRIIYKDADQCLNPGADFQELRDFDLQESPLGMAKHGQDSLHKYLMIRSQELSQYNPQLVNQTTYHCGGIIVKDLRRLNDFDHLEQVRHYYNNSLRDGLLTFNINDQDLIHYSQHLMPITELPWYWIYSHEMYGKRSKINAKNIDMYGTVKLGLEHGQALTKFELAQDKCYFYAKYYSDLDLLLNKEKFIIKQIDRTNSWENLFQPIVYKLQPDIFINLFMIYEQDFINNFLDIKMLDYMVGSSIYVYNSSFSLLFENLDDRINHSVFDYRRDQLTFSISNDNLKLHGSGVIENVKQKYEKKSPQNFQFTAIIKNFQINFTIAMSELKLLRNAYLIVQNITYDISSIDIQSNDDIKIENNSIISQMLREILKSKIQTSLNKVILGNTVFTKGFYMEQFQQVIDYFFNSYKQRVYNFEQKYNQNSLSNDDIILIGINFEDYKKPHLKHDLILQDIQKPENKKLELIFSGLFCNDKEIIKHLGIRDQKLLNKKQEFFNNKDTFYFRNDNLLTTHNLLKILPNIAQQLDEPKLVRLTYSYMIPEIEINNPFGIFLDENQTLLLNLPFDFRIRHQKQLGYWSQLRNYRIVFSLNIKQQEKQNNNQINNFSIQVKLNQLNVTHYVEVIDDEIKLLEAKVSSALELLNDQLSQNNNDFMFFFKKITQMEDFELAIQEQNDYFQLNVYGSVKQQKIKKRAMKDLKKSGRIQTRFLEYNQKNQY
ncbi:udp-glucose:glycoprotein glucosyltransferase [Stylonychia lemnae]|uniref:Udp-glucose:glycoprotein glucosyltransferase n=1 Tax=Stylonychia lemnae TaxID=5949 RepID=A0A078BCM3_STYLE|nr:udp-glucose:glycoprotein glucosyltransferase [Stylonychia lemnae]|eukprot:CDW91353.1 udp-glucose:glycoprotein glucosyltransferase [Stylonychia lemnae]